jgi:hypothetical protein
MSGRFFQWFQTYEYIRNFIARFAWMRADSLLLISGAFASFRRDALLAVGGFDPQCLVEDYELIHRLRRHAVDHGLDWDVRVVGNAHAITDAPSSFSGFMRQRRRWFAGFLQTQYWNRDMTGNRRYGTLGLLMLPVKAFDTVQPLYGLTAFALLLGFMVERRGAIVLPIFSVIGAKILIDFAFHLWTVHLYRRWTGDTAGSSLWMAVVTAIVEPFTFQLLRHTGAALGWVDFLGGSRAWRVQTRAGLAAADQYVTLHRGNQRVAVEGGGQGIGGEVQRVGLHEVVMGCIAVWRARSVITVLPRPVDSADTPRRRRAAFSERGRRGGNAIENPMHDAEPTRAVGIEDGYRKAFRVRRCVTPGERQRDVLAAAILRAGGVAGVEGGVIGEAGRSQREAFIGDGGGRQETSRAYRGNAQTRLRTALTTLHCSSGLAPRKLRLISVELFAFERRDPGKSLTAISLTATSSDRRPALRRYRS